jgi:hypothetical protein
MLFSVLGLWFSASLLAMLFMFASCRNAHLEDVRLGYAEVPDRAPRVPVQLPAQRSAHDDQPSVVAAPQP